MKLIFLSSVLLLTGCATTNNYSDYIEAHKSISKDVTMSEIACYNTVTEGMKSSDNTAKTAAMALMAQCKKQKADIEPPKKNWLGL
jgi:uncharacterized lipoprotein YajG